MLSLNFCVADHVFAVRFADEKANYRKLLPSYAPFFLPVSQQAPLFTLDVAESAVDTGSEGEVLGDFDCNGINHKICRLNEGYKIIIGNLEGGISCAFRCDDHFSRCEASLHGGEDSQAFGLNNAIMIAFAFSGAHHQTVLVHASVIEKDGKGYLFLGKSGTGKSTHSRLWLRHVAGCDLLNDDNPAVRIKDGQAIVYGTPWSGKTPCYKNRHACAGAFLRLRQAPRNAISREPVVKAFASVLSSCSTMLWDKPSYEGICQTVEGIVKRVPVFFMDCLPDEAAARLSSQTLVQ